MLMMMGIVTIGANINFFSFSFSVAVVTGVANPNWLYSNEIMSFYTVA